MADPQLSQAEIEALFSSLSPTESPEAKAASAPVASTARMNPDAISRFKEAQEQLWNTAAMSAGSMIGKELRFDGPSVTILEDRINLPGGAPSVCAEFSFSTSKDRRQVLIIPDEVANAVNLLTNGDASDFLSESTVDALKPFIESLLGGLSASAGRLKHENPSVVNIELSYGMPKLPPCLEQSDEVVQVQINLAQTATLGQVFWIWDTLSVLNLLDISPESIEAASPSSSTGTPMPDWPDENEDLLGEFDRYLDVPINLNVELARIKVLVKDVTEYDTGSIVEFDKMADDPVDIIVDGVIVARGHVVVVDDCYGVKISEFLTRRDRLVHSLTLK